MTVAVALNVTAGTVVLLMPGKTSWLFAGTGSKPEPCKVTIVPTAPLAGVTVVIWSGGWILKVIDPGSRSKAVAVTVTSPAALAVSVKVVVVPAAAICTAGGNAALPVPVWVSITVDPPAGAGSLDVIVTAVLAPTISVVVGALRTSATCCFTVSTVFVETV